MKGSLLHNGIMSYGKTFVALTRCLQIQLSTTNLVKRYAHNKGAKKEPPDILLSADVRGLAGYTCRRGGCIPLLVRSANQ